MNDEFLILTPISLESIRHTKFRYMTINLVPEECLEEEFDNVSHYLENIIESNPTLIEDTYLSLLSRITQSLNLLHSIELTEKQWETILGYWLIIVINGISERWQTLERIERMDGFRTVCLGSYDSEFSPRFESMEGKNFSESHQFNTYIYQELLRYFPGINWKHFPSPEADDLSKTKSAPSDLHTQRKTKTRTKQLIKHPLRILFRSFRLKPEVFIVANWIPRINYLWMSILTGRVIFSSESQFSKIKSSHARIETHRWLFAKEFDSNFTKACSEIIDRIAPLSLTKGFKNALNAIEKQGLSYSPEYVISNQHHCTGSDAQRIWFGV